MRTPQSWSASVVTVIGVLVIGTAAGGALFNLSGSETVVASFWAALACALSLAWGYRLAVLFIVPSATAFVTNELVSTSTVEPEFYSAVTQVAPVLLVALGLEAWSLRRYAQTPFEISLFVVLLAYVVLAVCASVYGSASCDASGEPCQDILLQVHLFDSTSIILTAANISAAGLAGGLVAIPALALLSGSRANDPQPTSAIEGGTDQPPRPRRLTLVVAITLCYVLRRRPPG
jgi:hypothetical protein